jgi:hypothetical protein
VLYIQAWNSKGLFDCESEIISLIAKQTKKISSVMVDQRKNTIQIRFDPCSFRSYNINSPLSAGGFPANFHQPLE